MKKVISFMLILFLIVPTVYAGRRIVADTATIKEQIEVKNIGLDATAIMTDSTGDVTVYLNSGGGSYIKNPLAIEKDSAAFGLDVLKIRYTDAQFVDEFWNGVSQEWAVDVSTGSRTIISKYNGWYELATGSTTGDEESIDWNDITTFINTKLFIFEARLQLSAITNPSAEVKVGLRESTDNYIMIAFDPSAQDTWYLQTSSVGATSTYQGSEATTDEVLLRFELTSDSQAIWYINDINQGTASSNIPAVLLQPFISIATEEDASHSVSIDTIKIWQNR